MNNKNGRRQRLVYDLCSNGPSYLRDELLPKMDSYYNQVICISRDPGADVELENTDSVSVGYKDQEGFTSTDNYTRIVKEIDGYLEEDRDMVGIYLEEPTSMIFMAGKQHFPRFLRFLEGRGAVTVVTAKDRFKEDESSHETNLLSEEDWSQWFSEYQEIGSD